MSSRRLREGQPEATDGRTTIALLPSTATWPLRHLVLRPGRPLAACHWEGDDLPTTHHFGIKDGEDIVGIGSLFERACDIAPGPGAWQLRGMATHPSRRNEGLGGRLLGYMLEYCRNTLGGRIMWCNARSPAVPFYRHHGFETVGQEFTIELIGPHYRMRQALV